MEKGLNIEITCLGRVLEGSGSIASTLPESGYEEFGESLRQSIAEIEEKNCTACLDGRKCLHNADGSEYRVRSRLAGGSVATLAMMGMGDRNFVEGLRDNTSRAEDLYETAEELSRFIDNEESTHVDCGATKGLKQHAKAVHAAGDANANVTFVRNHLTSERPEYNAQAMIDCSRTLAGKLADVLESHDYDGQEYIETVSQRSPHGVEELEVDEDAPNHGHAEQAVVLVFSETDDEGRPLHSIDDEKLAELTGMQVFTVNYDELVRQAERLGSTDKQKAQLLTASLLHHLAGVYGSLCDGSHPVYIVRVSA